MLEDRQDIGMKVVIDISRAGARADADKARWMVSRGMLREGKPYEVIGDTKEMYIDRFLIVGDERGQPQSLHESMLERMLEKEYQRLLPYIRNSKIDQILE